MPVDRLHMTSNDWLFTLSSTENVSPQQMDRLTRNIMEMGIKIHTDKQRWSDYITHVIFVDNDKPGKLQSTTATQQVLCGLASGCWVLKDSFIYRSYRHKCWQSEKDYVAFPSCLEFRKIIEEKGEEGKPFHNMIAVMISSDMARKSAYFQLIQAGGGRTIPGIINFKELNLREWQPGEINHVIIDPFYIREKKEQRHFLFQFMERAQKKLGTVNFLNYKYLSKYLKEGGVISTQDYVIRQEDYQDLNKLEKRRLNESRDSAAKRMKPSAEVIDLEEEFEKPVIELSDHSEEDDDIQCVEEVRVNEQDPSTRLYYESPVKDRDSKPKVQNYADICKRQKEEAALEKENMDVVIGDEEQDNGQTIQEPESAQNKEIDPSKSGDINKEPCANSATISSTDRPIIRLVSMNRLLQGSSYELEQQDAEPPVSGVCSTTNLLNNSLIPQVPGSCISPPVGVSSISVSPTAAEVSPTLKSKIDMAEGEEYEEQCNDEQLNIKPDLSSLPSTTDTSSVNDESGDSTTKNATEDVKPDIKPFVMELDMDNSVLEGIIAAINKRFEVTRSDFIFTNSGCKTLEYSTTKEATLAINKNSSTVFPKIKALYSLSGDLRKLDDTEKRMEHMNYIKYNWNINSKFDKATMNYLLIFCVQKEKDYSTLSMAFRLLSKYASLHLVTRSKDRESFISTLLGCLQYDTNQSKLSLSRTDGLGRVGEWWTNLVKSVISSLKTSSNQDNSRTGCYMTLELLVNWMVKDFYIWWKYYKKRETLLPLLHYFLQGDIMNGLSTTLLPLYQAFLLYHHSSHLPRRLLSMAYLMTSFLDSKKGDSDPAHGNKVKLVKKVSKCISSVNLEDNDLCIEVSLLEPGMLSSFVSSNLLAGHTQAPNILTLLNQPKLDKGSQMILENGIHKLVGAMQLHTISSMEEHLKSKRKEERLGSTNLQKYFDKDRKQREIHSGEMVMCLDSLSGLSLRTELVTFQQFRHGEKTIGPRGEALSSLLFKQPSKDSTDEGNSRNGSTKYSTAQKQTEKIREKNNDLDEDRSKVREDDNKSNNKDNSRDNVKDERKRDMDNTKNDKDDESEKRASKDKKDMKKNNSDKEKRKDRDDNHEKRKHNDNNDKRRNGADKDKRRNSNEEKKDNHQERKKDYRKN